MRAIIWAEIEAQAADRPPGYLEALVKAGTLEGPLLKIEDAAFDRIKREFPGPAGPSLLELAKNFAGAAERWRKAGFPVCSREVFEDRLLACQRCPEWGRDTIIARCDVCGCLSLKLWAATERCPIGKWL